MFYSNLYRRRGFLWTLFHCCTFFFENIKEFLVRLFIFQNILVKKFSEKILEKQYAVSMTAVLVSRNSFVVSIQICRLFRRHFIKRKNRKNYSTHFLFDCEYIFYSIIPYLTNEKKIIFSQVEEIKIVYAVLILRNTIISIITSFRFHH